MDYGWHLFFKQNLIINESKIENIFLKTLFQSSQVVIRHPYRHWKPTYSNLFIIVYRKEEGLHWQAIKFDKIQWQLETEAVRNSESTGRSAWAAVLWCKLFLFIFVCVPDVKHVVAGQPHQYQQLLWVQTVREHPVREISGKVFTILPSWSLR